MQYIMIRKIFTGLSAIAILLVLATGCEAERTIYNGTDYIMFSDTLHVLPIQDNETYFDIPISATKAVGYDRKMAVEIIDNNSNAIEGVHYKLESNTVTIEAGKLATSVRIMGIHDNIDIYDELRVSLRLITDKDTQWEMYGIDTSVELRKTCPFDINQFVGYAVLESTYFQYYMPGVDKRLIKSKLDPDNPNGIILEDYFYKGYDLKVEFDLRDPLHPLLKTDEQVFASTSDAFGTIYGEGEIFMFQPSNYTSYFSTCEGFMIQYMTLYVPDVDTVGLYMNILKWISDDEAEIMK